MMGNQGSGDSQEVDTGRKADIQAVLKAKKEAFTRSMSEAFAGRGWAGMPPRAGEYVETPFGPGVVESYRPDAMIYNVVLAWRVAEEAKVMGFFHAESVFKGEGKERASALELMANIMPNGQRVTTPFGAGEVAEFTIQTGIYKIILDWELDGGTHAVSYSAPDAVSFEVRGARGDMVLTPYGTATIQSVRESDGIHIVTLDQVSGGATAYLSADAILRKLKATCGSWVMTVFGKAKVLRYRKEDDIYIIALEYALAYINEEAILNLLDSKQQTDCVIA
jgi:hypothetical protein